ncbi:class C sortase [Streptococcus canis]|uniref:class C sortase n=1 Tax=Streptococcus canis TaxID=1329 RepID=UPI0013DC7D6D|nr:class C sortase [Streptococcus canis]QKG75264.1 class C sortase [Streptococcus canis]
MTNKQKKDHLSKFLIAVGFIFIVFSIAFLFLNHKRIELKKEESINLEKQIKQELPPFENYEKKDETKQSVAPKDSIEDTAIGVLRIDKIGVITPISDNTSEQSLLEGSGIVEDTDIPTSEENTITVLAGHRGGINETQSFLNIDKLEKGDELKITTREEELYYKVVDKEVIEPTDWSKFTREEGKTKLFLMACHPYPKNDKRLLVKAELIKNDEEINN